MHYIVIYSPTIQELIANVNKAMNDGWRPTGGIVVADAPSPSGKEFLQAMVR